MRADFAVLILAAGASRRLGRPKALVAVAGGTLIERTLELAHALGPRWVGVVLGAKAARIGRLVGGRAVRVRARRWREGLSASLRAGLAAVPPAIPRVLVLAVDQWALAPRDLARLLAVRHRGPVAASYAGTRGIPVVFPASWRRRLRRLAGDTGARPLLAESSVRAVPLAAAALDLDTPADLTVLRRAAGRRMSLK